MKQNKKRSLEDLEQDENIDRTQREMDAMGDEKKTVIVQVFLTAFKHYEDYAAQYEKISFKFGEYPGSIEAVNARGNAFGCVALRDIDKITKAVQYDHLEIYCKLFNMKKDFGGRLKVEVEISGTVRHLRLRGYM
jgi:hypothetical protein